MLIEYYCRCFAPHTILDSQQITRPYALGSPSNYQVDALADANSIVVVVLGIPLVHASVNTAVRDYVRKSIGILGWNSRCSNKSRRIMSTMVSSGLHQVSIIHYERIYQGAYAGYS
jgi:hypothetical protein